MRSARFQIMFLHNACYLLIASLVAVLLSVFSWQHILNVKTAAYDRLDLFSLTDRGNGVRACVRCSASHVLILPGICLSVSVSASICVCVFFSAAVFCFSFFFFLDWWSMSLSNVWTSATGPVLLSAAGSWNREVTQGLQAGKTTAIRGSDSHCPHKSSRPCIS